MSRAIDVMHLGRERVICAFELQRGPAGTDAREGGSIVDPGPASCVDTLLESLGGEAPRALLLTHIHLDHAGATGVLVRHFPDLKVYVHERGAPHLVDPSKLLRSAQQLYGDDMERLWGEVAPVPEENLHVLSGGERVEGLLVEYAPGHASHHVCYLDEDTGDAYVGDVAGVRIPPHDYTVAPTPPPDIDVDAWLDSIEKVESWRARALCLTHFGRFEDGTEHLARVRESLLRNADAARAGDGEAFVAGVEREARSALDPASADSLIQAAPPEQLWLGLERYWRKRVERENAECERAAAS